jgi:hypothetical protein
MDQINSRQVFFQEDAAMDNDEEAGQTLGQKRYWTKLISLNSTHMPLNMKFDIKVDMKEMEQEIAATGA